MIYRHALRDVAYEHGVGQSVGPVSLSGVVHAPVVLAGQAAGPTPAGIRLDLIDLGR